MYQRDKTVKVSVGRPLNVEGTSVDVVDGLIVEKDGDISVFQE